MIRLVFSFLFLMAFGQMANAQVLFSDNFQDGNTQGWQGNPGKGDMRLTRFKKNISMRLQHDAYAIYLVPTKKYEDISVSADFASLSLKSKDFCILETSFGGNKWTEIGRIGDMKDDGMGLHKLSGLAPKATGHKLLAVRLRIAAQKDSASCWADNVQVRGRASLEKLEQKITLETMLSNAPLSAPYAMKAYAPPRGATLPRQGFNGKLVLGRLKQADGFLILKDDFSYEMASGKLKQIPPFAINFVSDGDAIIPVKHGPIPSFHPDWEWIFGAGKIWNEVSDNGWSRAAVPIALQERNANCIHNGLMSFLYKGDIVSNAVVQIGSETCAYLQFDMWSKLSVSKILSDVVNTRRVKFDFQKEIKWRLPRRSIADLRGTDIAQIGASQEVSPENMTVYGFAKDGQLYASECNTRHGPNPYCAEMALPSYSMAKSIVASIGLMRLEKLYPEARAAKISDYVPQCKAKIWGDVSFEQALDMTTGNYTSQLYDKDEAGPKTWKSFMSEETHGTKIKHACTVHKRKSKPGTQFVYHTTDTYILGTAMQAYLREKSGNPKADLYDNVLLPIWRVLELGPFLNKTRRTYDEVAQPFTGWGLTMHADDLVRIGLFLQKGGRIEGNAWLDQSMLAAALQQNPNDRGHKAINDNLRYRAGVWAYNAGPFLGCKGDLWIPNMSGFGGLANVLMPNGHIYFYVSDGHEYAWRRAAKASNELQPFCETKQ